MSITTPECKHGDPNCHNIGCDCFYRRPSGIKIDTTDLTESKLKDLQDQFKKLTTQPKTFIIPMATQGLLSIVGKEDHVLAKVVAGSDGQNVMKLADMLRGKAYDPETLYEKAVEAQLGNPSNLVVMRHQVHDEFIVQGVERSELNPFYFKTFQQSKFNPRWEQGTADFTVVLYVMPDGLIQ